MRAVPDVPGFERVDVYLAQPVEEYVMRIQVQQRIKLLLARLQPAWVGGHIHPWLRRLELIDLHVAGEDAREALVQGRANACSDAGVR